MHAAPSISHPESDTTSAKGHGLGDSRGGVHTGTEAYITVLYIHEMKVSVYSNVYHCICFIIYHYFHSGQEAEEMWALFWVYTGRLWLL